MRILLAKPMYLKLRFLFLDFYPIVDKLCLSRQSLPSAVMMFVGVASAEASLTFHIVFHMQTNYPEIKLKIVGLKYPWHSCAATLTPRHVWFLLSWAEIHMNNLAVCQDIVFPTCSPMVWILAWWSSWKKTSKSLGPVTRTISRLVSSPLLLLLHHVSSHVRKHAPWAQTYHSLGFVGTVYLL